MASRCYFPLLSSRQVFKFLRNRSNVNNTRKFTENLREPAQPLGDKQPKWMSAEEAVKVVKTGDTVFVQGAAATPRVLVPALAEHGKKSGLKNVTVCHIHTEGAAEYNHPECAGIFRSNSFFVGANCREAINSGRGDFVPIFLSEIPLLFHRKIVPVDVAMVQITPADSHGYCSIGTSVDCTRAALMHAKYVIGQVNPRLPRTFGDATIHISHFDALVEGERELPEHKADVLTDVELNIGKLIANNLVENGATLQMGIGSIPDAVLASLKNHKDLGIHSEMFSDGVVDLVNTGCINNKYKAVYAGKIVGSFTIGTRKLFDFMDNNPFVVMLNVDYVNHSDNIAINPKMTAINSCIEVDLTGQVCSDSIGTRIYSGVGGQIDFLRGAAMGKDGKGKPILAMPSCTSKGESKIVPFIKQGGGVVTSRSHIHYLVTEHGIADLFGKNIRQRAYHLIQIAHPKHREALEKAAFERLKCMPSP
ncbi:4-hydroxybutyrate coenzyme A transferase-like [Stegodyphus dumicola]|uniref:4-hydroxybutyrate coenzyme A transferase-like n=1 Tax=Stegodyphus dumicola TaxID=202533 RepID=UPI0015AC4F94|nr:4-hydroxybutyrate coenzyme A transferase-like [Stegodyphus dumicola]